MEVSWIEEEELCFACESPSPQPQPDLLIDLSPSDEGMEQDSLNDPFKTSTATTEVQSQMTTTMTTKTKKKKSSTRTESISVETNLPDVFREVSVERARRSFGDMSDLESQEDDFDFLQHGKRPKSSLEEASDKSSMSKLNLMEEKQTQGIGSQAAPGGPDSVEKKAEEHKKLCKACGNQVFAMECLKAEKAEWHKRCFKCTACSKVLSVEAYSSHEGRLYCRPHFRELFQPKVATNGEIPDKVLDKTEVIIRESDPAPLPEGVLRASEPVDRGLEDLHLDLKSKFQLFENFQQQQEKERRESPPQPKRSGTVLAKLAKYQSKVGMDVGVPDEALAGGHGPTEEQEASSDDEVDNARKPHILDEINSEAIDSVRNKWAQGMTNRSDVIAEHRREEQSKFRTRLLLGKNVQLKEMYERAVGESTPESKPLSPDEIVKSDTAKGLKELFEKGEFKDGTKSESKLEGEVFESAIAKQSRQLFRELDKGAASQTSPPMNPTPKPKRIDRTESLTSADVIKSSDVIEETIKPVDLGSKFKFFEEGGHLEKKMEKKTFRITPPREQNEADEEEVEIYRDPSIVRSSDSAEPVIPVTRTASKMLSVFRQLEQGNKEEKVARPLKEFTPPREPLGSQCDEEDESEEDSTESPSPSAFKEDHLREVGGLARATSLRAKFEKWEAEENERNVAFEKESPSIESTKDLRAKFENLKREEEEKLRKRREVKVNRFVELTNSGVMESCVLCEKRVYVMEKTEAGGKIYHKSCFKCSVCKCVLRMDTFTSNKGTLYCTPHFKQLFKIKGNYDEGFGHDTQRIQWEKKKAKAEDKEN